MTKKTKMKKRFLTTNEINSIPCSERWFRLKPVVSFEIYYDDPLNGWLAHVTGQNVFVMGYELR